MGGPYEIPRNYKGESKIFFIFSGKSFIYTGVGGFLGVLLYNFLFSPLKLGTVGLIVLIVLALLGFVIGTFKVPENNKFEFMRKTGGENIDDVIKRWIKFKFLSNKNKIYIYKENEEVRKDG